MGGLPDPDWYFEHVLQYAAPDGGGLVRGPAAQWRDWWRDRDLAGLGIVASPAEVAAAGVSRQTARTRVRRGRWTAAGRGYVAPVDISGPQPYVVARRRHALECAAAARRRSEHAISGRSGAVVHGLPTFRIPSRPELTAFDPVSLGRRRGSTHVYGATISAADVTDWFGVPVTTVARTLVDLARHDRRDAIMAGDAALRELQVDCGQLRSALDGAVGWPGVRQAREVLGLLDPRAESPLESLTRLVLHDDGFPAPELQVWLGADRVDMLFVAQRLVLEIDGRDKYGGGWSGDEETVRDPLWKEKRRERRLRALNYRVERVTWDEVVVRWPETRTWLRAAVGLPD